MNSLFKFALCVSLCIVFSIVAIKVVKTVTGRQYEFIDCKEVTLIFHNEWSGSPTECSVWREKNGRKIGITVDSTERVSLKETNRRITVSNSSETPWVHWATIKNAIIYLRKTKTGVEFVKWRDGFSISGHATVEGYNLESPSAEDSVVNWHLSNIRQKE
jgi:hypothetical protein